MLLFQEYVDVMHGGNQSEAARALGIDRSMVSRILRGERGVSPEIAERVDNDSEGRFPKEKFIWPEAED